MFKGDIKLDIEKEKRMCSTLQLLDDHLAKSKYSVGSKLTIADFSLLCSLDLLTNVMDYDISDFKFVAGYQAR